ncbi:MAG: hypothetical protein MJ244_04340 [Clostridia bacterium]|nr:hypothetical protein [Clostridia bacterium]
MSDFLQFVDRIPTLPNRKKLTFENDGSVKYATVEYADDPAEEGTFLNKANFNKLNAILGYNEIIATQESEIGDKIVTNPNVNGNELYNSSSSSIKTTSGTFTSNFGNINIVLSSRSGSTRLTPSGGGFYLTSTRYNSSIHNVNIEIEFDNEVYFEKVHTSSGSGDYATLYVSDFNIYDINNNALSWIENGKVGSYTAFKSSGRVKKMIFNRELDKYSGTGQSYFYFDDSRYQTVVLTNKFIDNTFDGFINQQMYKIKPIINVSGSEANTFNDIKIDTLLENNKYYELLYDQLQNKFIAEEVRNAN